MNAPFSGRLLTHETIVWSGRPVQGLKLMKRDLYLVPFSLLWGGFAVFWESQVVTTKAPFFMELFGVPFVLIGLFLIFGRLPFDAWLRAKTHYALTDRRALILREAPFGSFTALALDRLTDVALIETSRGRGTIRLERPVATFWNNNNSSGVNWLPALDSTSQFLDIPDAARVFAMVQERATPARPVIGV